jgi:hypothetical protein
VQGFPVVLGPDDAHKGLYYTVVEAVEAVDAVDSVDAASCPRR